MSRRKILVLAAACHPEQGSEPGLGWNWSVRLADHHDIVVVTSDFERSRTAIERRLAEDPALASRIRFNFLPWFEAPTTGIRAWAWNFYQPLYYAAYEQWMREAFAVARRLVAEEGGFDLCHQLNMIGFREPGYLWELPLPFVWGPVGGTQNVPWGMLAALGPTEGLRHLSRNVINEYQKRFSDRFRRALARAGSVISVASDTADTLKKLHGVNSEVIAAAFGTAGHPRARVRRPTAGLRFIYTGQHLSRKGVPFALQALARLDRHLPWTFDVLGTGAMTASWQRMVQHLGIADRVTFHGFVTRDRLFELLGDSDVYVFPSLLEGWPASIAEALSLGLPVVSTDHQGMRDMVTPSCGLLVDPSRLGRLVAGLESAFRRLIENQELVTTLSKGALLRAEEISAERQLPAVLQTYERVLAAGDRIAPTSRSHG
jgi:glycosyltransferase involved in cell wall biosynthesis